MKNSIYRQRGFTLIELLVVVALIGVLATLVLANLNAARQRGRDAQRKGDLRNIQTALRLYYNDYGVYPDNIAGNIAGCGDGDDICIWGGSFATSSQTYMSTLPTDPLPGIDYNYDRDDTDIDKYTLTACLENISDEKGQSSSSCSSGWEYVVQP